MVTRAEEHARTGRDMLSQARDAVGRGDLLQASEKGWGAAAHMVKAVAERRGWQHAGHRELYVAVNRLAQETDDGHIRTMFHVAGSLHGNFYENLDAGRNDRKRAGAGAGLRGQAGGFSLVRAWYIQG